MTGNGGFSASLTFPFPAKLYMSDFLLIHGRSDLAPTHTNVRLAALLTLSKLGVVVQLRPLPGHSKPAPTCSLPLTSSARNRSRW